MAQAFGRLQAEVPWHQRAAEEFVKRRWRLFGKRGRITELPSKVRNHTTAEHPAFPGLKVVFGDFGDNISIYEGHDRVFTVSKTHFSQGAAIDRASHREVLRPDNFKTVAKLALALHKLLLNHAPREE